MPSKGIQAVYLKKGLYILSARQGNRSVSRKIQVY